MSNEMKHTPGEWTVLPAESDKPYLRIRGTRLGGRYKIADVHCQRFVSTVPELDVHELQESLANARLIAAAPEILAALKWKMTGSGRFVSDEECLAAIAKATGA